MGIGDLILRSMLWLFCSVSGLICGSNTYTVNPVLRSVGRTLKKGEYYSNMKQTFLIRNQICPCSFAEDKIFIETIH